MAVPVSSYLRISEICQYLSADGNSKNLLFKGDTTRPNQSRLIYMVREAVQWLFDRDPTNTALPKQSNYLYSLCNPYVAEAQRIINAGTSGNIVNPSTGNLVTIATPTFQFKVGEMGALMFPPETNLVILLSGIVSASVEITLDGVELPYGRNDVLSYTVNYTPTAITIVFNQGVVNGQLYFIRMVQLVPV